MKRRTRAQSSLPVALSIAGSDSGGGAGIQADLLTFAALGVFGTTAITCLTAQNPDGVSAVHEAPAEMVREQIHQVATFFAPTAVKTGMLFSAAIVDVVATFAAAHRRTRIVVDPVMVATSGARLLREDAIAALCDRLFPHAALVTPNLDEAAVLLGRRPAHRGEIIDAAEALATRFRVPFLLKGGHLEGDRLVDVLARPRALPVVHSGRRVHDVDTHGSGCTLSAAVAALLARGHALEEAVVLGRRFLQRGLKRPLEVRGRRFIAHG
jgi:hydroxymethylpyrimidine/phosphomethylpyrimidine kinase